MNGVHDMGGMHGLGPIAPDDPDEPLFHEPWEARVLAMTLAIGAWGRWNIDTSRRARESIPGPDYLRMSYYEKWLVGLEDLMLSAGLVTRDEIRTGRPAPGQPPLSPPLTADRVANTLAAGGPATRDTAAPHGFAIGEPVRARNINPLGHTRLPATSGDEPASSTATTACMCFPTPTLMVWASSPTVSTVCASWRASCGARRRAPETACIWTCGMPISNIPDHDEPAFAEPWQAQVFALTIALHEQGAFTWTEWAAALGVRVKTADGEAYYAAWLNALESLLAAKGLADRDALGALKIAWADAYRHAPHGTPVELKR